MGTKPRSTSPDSVAASTSGIDVNETSSIAARSGCVSSACSLNVPAGPRKPMRDIATEATARQHVVVDEKALRELLDGVRAGTVRPDDAVASLRRLPWADLGFARV